MSDDQSDNVRKYPLFKKNLKLEELYEKQQEKLSQPNIIRDKFSGKQVLWALAVFAILLSIPLTINEVKKQQTIQTKASHVLENTSAEPESASLSGDLSIQSDIAASSEKYIRFGERENIVNTSSCTSLPENADRANLPINIPSTSSYYLWIRMMSPNDSDNSIHFQIDKNCPIIVGDRKISPNSWIWINYQNSDIKNRIKFDMEAGTHDMTLIGREANVKIDRIILTSDKNCVPILSGQNCL